MYPISPVLDYFLQSRDRIWQMKVDIDGTEYGKDVVVGFEISSSLADDEFTIGTAMISSLKLTIKSNAAIPPNARIIPYIAMATDSLTWDQADMAWEDADIAWGGGVTDWLPLGEFYVDTRERSTNVWVYSCRDKLARADTAYVSELAFPASMQDVFDDICDTLEYTYDASVVIDPTYSLPAAPEGMTMRQVLGYIAGANSANVMIGKDGTMQFARFSAAAAPVYNLLPRDYTRMKQTNPVKSYTRVVVTYDTERQLTYEAGSGDADHTLQLINPFATQAIVDDLQAVLNGFAYQPYEMDARGYPQLDIGDTVTIAQQQGMSWFDADMPWDDADTPWDGLVTVQSIILHQSFSFKGGLKMSLESPSKSEQRSEFPVVGPISSRINKLDQTTVKQNRPYYGVTTSHEEGLVIDRDDGAAKVVLNADELTFYKGASKALWFDVPNDAYKFTGVLEASSFVGGTIKIGSGTSVFKADSNGIYLGNETFGSAPFRVTPGGALTASNATVTGTINATGGSFSGSISASGTITGGTISGATVNGSLIQTQSSGSYPRAFLATSGGNPNSFGVEGSSTKKLVSGVLTGSYAALVYADGSNVTSISQVGTDFQVESTGPIYLETHGGGLYVDGVRIG